MRYSLHLAWDELLSARSPALTWWTTGSSSTTLIGPPVVQQYGWTHRTRVFAHTNSRSACLARTHLTHQDLGQSRHKEADLPCWTAQFPVAQSVNPWYQPTPWATNVLTPRVHSPSPFAPTVKRISRSTRRERESANRFFFTASLFFPLLFPPSILARRAREALASPSLDHPGDRWSPSSEIHHTHVNLFSISQTHERLISIFPGQSLSLRNCLGVLRFVGVTSRAPKKPVDLSCRN